MQDLTCKYVLREHEGWIRSLLVHKKRLYSCSYDKTIKVKSIFFLCWFVHELFNHFWLSLFFLRRFARFGTSNRSIVCARWRARSAPRLAACGRTASSLSASRKTASCASTIRLVTRPKLWKNTRRPCSLCAPPTTSSCLPRTTAQLRSGLSSTSTPSERQRCLVSLLVGSYGVWDCVDELLHRACMSTLHNRLNVALNDLVDTNHDKKNTHTHKIYF